MQTFSLGTELFSGLDALSRLSQLGAKTVLLVTDPRFTRSGLARAVLERTGAEGRIFDGARPDPTAEQAAQGAALLQSLQPDTLVALGGGSVLDCAKGILLAASQRPRFVAIPTTSGTGSEVTSVTVLTHSGIKHPIRDRVLRPDVAILDDSLLRELPGELIAQTGMDALTHCAEAVCATGRTPITDALACHAGSMLLQLLPRSYAGDDSVRGQVHVAAAMSGMAFENAGLGVLHALAHALGGRFHLPHGILGGILLPAVMEFNRSACLSQYALWAAACGIRSATELLAVRELRRQLIRLRTALELPGTLREAGVPMGEVEAAMDSLTEAALEDGCLAGNPRPVSREDLRRLIREVTD